MIRIKLFIIVIALLSLMACSASLEAAITVDGNLSDWGVTCNSTTKHLDYNSAYGYSYPTSNANVEVSSNQSHTPITYNNNKIFYDLEDSNDSWDHSQKVGPLYGGQDYDAEAMLVSVVHNTKTGKDDLYIGISTGQRPDNGVQYFAPGDICITKGTNTFGIEVGGGQGDTNKKTGAITDGAAGSTYNLVQTSGYTNSSKPLLNTNSQQTAGSIWKGGTWDAGLPGSGDMMTQLETGGTKGGTYLENCDQFDYNFDSSYGQHAFIELCIQDYQDVFGDSLNGASIRSGARLRQ